MKTTLDEIRESFLSLGDAEFRKWFVENLTRLTTLEMQIIVKSYNMGKKDAYKQDDVPSGEEFVYQNFPKKEDE
jgi:hypothetical protein